MENMEVNKNKKMKETIGKDFEGELMPQEVEVATRNVARDSGDVAENEVNDALRAVAKA